MLEQEAWVNVLGQKVLGTVQGLEALVIVLGQEVLQMVL